VKQLEIISRIQQLEIEFDHYRKLNSSISPPSLINPNHSFNQDRMVFSVMKKQPLSPTFSLGGKKGEISSSAAKLRHSLENRVGYVGLRMKKQAIKGVMDISFSSEEEEEHKKIRIDSVKHSKSHQTRTLEPLPESNYL
jgi:hypothetical protein